ncbi:MAG: flagellar hook-basal body protein [Bacteroidetes bacterium]|nr:flagellar hook-basal body protein [Bacteroidota bacterium]
MLERLRSAANAMSILLRRQEHLAHQLANLDTAGYKRDRLFLEMLQEALREDSTYQTQVRLQQWLEPAQGELEHTGGQLDVALLGPGWLAVEQAGEVLYTRNGRLHWDEAGFLRTSSGAFVLGQTGPIRLEEAHWGARVRIDGEGVLWLEERRLDRLRLVHFARPERLEKLGGSLVRAPADMRPQPDTQTRLRQGYLERSTVDPLAALAELIALHRLFEFQQRSLQTADGLLGRVTSEMAKL